MTYAGYKKRVFATCIDLIMVYPAIVILMLFVPIPTVTKWTISFWIVFMYHIIGYFAVGRTVGDLIFGLKVIVLNNEKNKAFLLILRSFLLSSFYVPPYLSLFWYLFFAIVLIFSLSFQALPSVKSQRRLFWEVSTNTIVIEVPKDKQGEF